MTEKVLDRVFTHFSTTSHSDTDKNHSK
ncbi:Protein of unknown function [Bacillus cereus]|nr:Protein of unknown function [Bacillus cereus]